jgi:hypothetical protein
MTITASQGEREIPIDLAKDTIRKIISRNPAIQTAIDNLLDFVSRDQAIFEVYDQNYVFWQEVDWKLNDL